MVLEKCALGVNQERGFVLVRVKKANQEVVAHIEVAEAETFAKACWEASQQAKRFKAFSKSLDS